jgi:hypothetical protein
MATEVTKIIIISVSTHNSFRRTILNHCGTVSIDHAVGLFDTVSENAVLTSKSGCRLVKSVGSATKLDLNTVSLSNGFKSSCCSLQFAVRMVFSCLYTTPQISNTFHFLLVAYTFFLPSYFLPVTSKNACI